MTFKIIKDLLYIFGLWTLFLRTQWVSAEFPWWEVEKNTEVNAFRWLRSSNLYLRRAPQIDLSGVHSCYEFKVTPFDRGGVTIIDIAIFVALSFGASLPADGDDDARPLAAPPPRTRPHPHCGQAHVPVPTCGTAAADGVFLMCVP